VAGDVGLDTGAHFEAIEMRLVIIERVQSINLPRLNIGLERLDSVEKTVNANSSILATLKSGYDTDAALRAENAQKLDDILSLISHTKTAMGIVRRHAPRVLAFAIGVAMAKGWITVENGQNFLHAFGF
jgi:hypothetical protein